MIKTVLKHIYCKLKDDKLIPYTLKHELVAQIPSLKKKYLKFENYVDQTLNDIFSEEELAGSIVQVAEYFESSIIRNNGDKTFTVEALPVRSQMSPCYAIEIFDANGDGYVDVLLGGNLRKTKPEAGHYDGKLGTVQLGGADGQFTVLNHNESGLKIPGDVRDFQQIVWKNQSLLLVGNNSAPLQIFTW